MIFSYWLNLIPDECSYWAWSRRLDWSYFDNSGMAAYLIRLSTALFGESAPFSVRFPFLLLSAFGTFLAYRVSEELFGDRSRAILAALAVNLTPAALLGGAAAVHDNALTFFWIAAMWAAARFVRREDGRWFYVMGLFAGLAILSKYTGVLVIGSILLFLIWNPPYRRWLWRKEPWLGLLISVSFTLPILWWNYRHDWASLHHILFIGAGADSILRRVLDGFGYHLAQLIVISPPFYAAIVVALGAGVARNLRRPRPEETVLLCFSLPLPMFGVMAFKGHVEANWAFMGYCSATILAVELVARAWRDGPSGAWKLFGRRFLGWGALLSVGPVILVVLHAWIGLLPAFVEARLDKADRIIWETRGWDGLGRHAAEVKREGDVLAADSYQLCALLEFNTPGQPEARYLAPWKRPTQFDVWRPSFDDLAGRNIIFVSSRELQPSSPAITTVYENFAEIERLPPYEVIYHGSVIRRVYLCRGHGFDPFSPIRLKPRTLLYMDY
jgi:4-amino-4-deoxy-L-arabinose transferase-like glycosyltransferase